MKQLNLEISTENKPYYLRLAQALEQSIKSGQVKIGEKLPSARSLAEQLQVNRHTVMRSYGELVAQGWVENLQRSHYRVSLALPIERSRKIHKDQSNSIESFQWSLQKQTSETNFTKSSAHFQYNFSGGKPDTDLFPFDEYRSHINDALKSPRAESLNYGENQGDPNLIEQGLIYLRRGRSVQHKELIITNGSQEALFLISQMLLSPGDKVAVETLGYPPARQAFQAAGANLVEVIQDQAGISTKHLRHLARSQQLKCIYLTPLHQYPTTVTLSAGRRAEIYQLAMDYNLFIIEDDYDHEFHYRCQPIPPMAAADPANLVIYLTSFSKIMFPAARAGMLAVPAALLQPLVNFRTTINHKPPMLLQDALARWMASGGFERHIRRCTKAYQQRYKNALQQLRLANRLGAQMHCQVPDGGMALWVKTSVDCKLLAALLAEQSIYIQHQGEFSSATSSALSRHIRLGFAGQSIEAFNLGFNKIVNLVLRLQQQ
ncbi:GntR family transcriptional regulator ['Osedax' symbiont bacterium Rs2_46_30_T18]|nr:GntR family transcriptional regulator ['Osedax' symbiont bacterium Rs2_46_30_T18]